MAEKAIVAKLAADGPVSALVVARIHPDGEVPQGVSLPFIAYRLIDADYAQSKSNDDGWAQSLIEVRSVAETYAGAKSLSLAVRRAIQGKAFTAASIAVTSVILKGESDQAERAGDGRERARFTVTQDYLVAHRVSIPT